MMHPECSPGCCKCQPIVPLLEADTNADSGECSGKRQPKRKEQMGTIRQTKNKKRRHTGPVDRAMADPVVHLDIDCGERGERMGFAEATQPDQRTCSPHYALARQQKRKNKKKRRSASRRAVRNRKSANRWCNGCRGRRRVLECSRMRSATHAMHCYQGACALRGAYEMRRGVAGRNWKLE